MKKQLINPRLFLLIVILGTASLFLYSSTLSANNSSLRDFTCPNCNLIIISIDTLRADRLQTLGYKRQTSPALLKFSHQAMIFENAYSPASKTAEAHMSLFTSLYPSVHRVDSLATKDRKSNKVDRLDKRIKTLSEILKKNGYSTAGFHHGGQLAAKFGFARGFDTYQLKSWVEVKKEFAQMGRWLRKNRDDKFFLFLHTYHVHDPYTPRLPYDLIFDPDYSGKIISDPTQLATLAKEACKGIKDCTLWDKENKIYWDSVDLSSSKDVHHISALYDGEIREVDDLFIRLNELLQEVSSNSIIIILSDHGEEFLEHGGTLHHKLYQEIIRVPLLIMHPGLKKGFRVNQEL